LGWQTADAARGTSVEEWGGDATDDAEDEGVSSDFSSCVAGLGVLPMVADEAGGWSAASGEGTAGSFVLFTATTGFAGLWELK